jgi:hypothetical protein
MSVKDSGGTRPVPVRRTEPVDELRERPHHLRRRGRALVGDHAELIEDAHRDREALGLRRRDVDGWADRAGAGVDLGLAEVEGVGALDLARGDVVPDRVPDDPAALGEDEADLGLGDVPDGVAADADRLVGPDRGASLRKSSGRSAP